MFFNFLSCSFDAANCEVSFATGRHRTERFSWFSLIFDPCALEFDGIWGCHSTGQLASIVSVANSSFCGPNGRPSNIGGAFYRILFCWLCASLHIKEWTIVMGLLDVPGSCEGFQPFRISPAQQSRLRVRATRRDIPRCKMEKVQKRPRGNAFWPKQ